MVPVLLGCGLGLMVVGFLGAVRLPKSWNRRYFRLFQAGFVLFAVGLGCWAYGTFH